MGSQRKISQKPLVFTNSLSYYADVASENINNVLKNGIDDGKDLGWEKETRF